MASANQLDRTFSALADPTRREMLMRLRGGQMTVTELANPFALSLPAISKHLKVLERAGLIERGRDAQWRPCRLRRDALTDAASWIDQQRKAWEGRFDRLDAYLADVQGKPRTRRKARRRAATDR